MSTMISREAFEAHILRTTGERPYMVGGAYNSVGWRKSWEYWQAAIQHARNVAVKALEAEKHKIGPADTVCSALEQAADAIKEALK